MLRSALVLPLVLPLVACSAATAADAPAPPPPAPMTVRADECPTADATACDGLSIKHCEAGADGNRWGAAAPCDGAQICKDTACRALTADEQSHTAALAALLDESRTVGATAKPVDYDGLGLTLKSALLLGDGTPRAYVQTMWQAMLAIPQGHQVLSVAEAMTPAEIEAAGFTTSSVTRYSACLRPYRDHAVAVLADPGSPLQRGDEIMAIDGKRGDALHALLVGQPDGADYLPITKSGRAAFALRNFFSIERAGTVLTVRHPGSTAEVDVTLPKAGADAQGYGCDDAFGRDYTRPAIGTILPDGTGVLYIPGFTQTTVADFEAQVGLELDKVKTAPRLVIDIRGNGGGYLKSAIDLVSQLPGARKQNYCEFWERDTGSKPATYSTRGVRTIDPAAVSQPPRLAYQGRVALLIDGATHSAAEHVVLATRAATTGILVIGTKTAGSYGNVSTDVPRTLAGSPRLMVSMNRSQVRTPTGTVMDGTSGEPDIEVEYEPAQIAKGEDPMLARAVVELSK